VLWELPVNERKQVKNAMTWRRPLPPRLARVSGFIGIAGLGAASAGLLWLLIGVIWLRAVAWSRRAARTGRWPERG
jgi:hypothetical protein